MKFLAIMAAIILFNQSCTEDDPVFVSANSTTITNLAADPATGRDPNTGAPTGTTDKFTFFRFSDSSIVAHSDSATAKWDIGFKGSEIILNSGISGPGEVSGFTYNGLYAELKEVPADSAFKKDASNTSLVIGKTWYSYNPTAMTLQAKAGKTFVINTADRKYVKMEILSYYKDAPANPNAFTDKDRYYTFRYACQQDGSKRFE